MKAFWIIVLIAVIVLFGPSILKWLGTLFTWLYKLISLTGYKGLL